MRDEGEIGEIAIAGAGLGCADRPRADLQECAHLVRHMIGKLLGIVSLTVSGPGRPSQGWPGPRCNGSLDLGDVCAPRQIRSAVAW
jgi:hypothetical protein